VIADHSISPAYKSRKCNSISSPSALLVLRPDAAEMDDAAATALQDAHMAHLADLHDAGYLVAAGPPARSTGARVSRPEHPHGRPGARAKALKEQDPAVLAGRFSVQFIPLDRSGGSHELCAHPLSAVNGGYGDLSADR